MSKTIKIKRGYDLNLVGEAQPEFGTTPQAETYALKPTDFKDIIPKLILREGAEVKAGDAIFVDKDRPDIKFSAPVSGEITEVRRGEKRKILEIVILADKEVKYIDFGKADPNTLERDAVMQKMLDSGAWPLLIERPFGVVADPTHQPKNIFVTGINSVPFGADVNLSVAGEEMHLQTGLDALAKLTDGKVYLSLDADKKPAEALSKASNVEVVYFSGPHPKGNVGVQMHHLSPYK
jgi:Na+-transporting NADH:ubiquinone oxidoreductase subunit A